MEIIINNEKVSGNRKRRLDRNLKMDDERKSLLNKIETEKKKK